MFHHFRRWFYFYPCKALDKEAWDKDSETSNNSLLVFLFPNLMNIYPLLKNWKRETMCESLLNHPTHIWTQVSKLAKYYYMGISINIMAHNKRDMKQKKRRKWWFPSKIYRININDRSRPNVDDIKDLSLCKAIDFTLVDELIDMLSGLIASSSLDQIIIHLYIVPTHIKTSIKSQPLVEKNVVGWVGVHIERE